MKRSGVIMLVAAACLLAAAGPGHAGRTAAAEFLDEARRDQQLVLSSRRGLGEAVRFLASQPGLVSRGKRLLTRREKMAAWTAWSVFLDHLAALDLLGSRYSGRQPDAERRSAAFALAAAAFHAEYRFALQFIALVEKNPALDTVLNEEVPEAGLPAGTYGRIKFRFLNVLRATEFGALEVAAAAYPFRDDAAALEIAMQEDRKAIWAMGKGKGPLLTLQNAVDIIGKAGFAAWFPIQKGVAGWMGDVRVRRGETALIGPEQIRDIPSRLQPGDILLERREWYLSNLGLPGFWTHAALYIGSPGERTAFFDAGEVRAWVRGQGIADGRFESLLASRSPAAASASAAPHADGHVPRVLEAVSEGVSFTTLEHSAAADSLAVLRPRLSRVDVARALLRAFHFSGRPYDFKFDFLTDSSLVCSELIYKTYEPGPLEAGISFDLDEIMGKRLATPNGMARQFDREFDSGGRQMDLVLFLDGSEKTGSASEAGVAVFRKSWTRPKWHILFSEPPEDAARRSPDPSPSGAASADGSS